MTTETRADFARRMGWNRSSVTRAVQDGRVVLLDGLVDVDASLAKIDALASPYAHHRAHVQQLEEARHAKTPTASAVAAVMHAYAPLEDLQPTEGIEALNLRLKRAEANKREHEADMARMEKETMAGNLIAREDVEFAMDDFGATLRSLMENLADRLAPVVHPLQSIEETHAALSEAAQDVLRTVHDQLQQKATKRRTA